MTKPQYLSVLESAKAYVALVGSICTALLAVFAADTTVGQILTVLSVIATAVGTYKVPNADSVEGDAYPAEDGRDDFVG